MTAWDDGFDERLAATLGQMAVQVPDTVAGPSPALIRRVHRRMSVVAVGAALLASALGLAGAAAIGFVTGDGLSVLPHDPGSTHQAAVQGGVGWGSQGSEFRVPMAVTVAVHPQAQTSSPGATFVRPATPPPARTGHQGGNTGPVIVDATGGIGGHGKGRGRHHGHGHRHHRGGGNRRMH